jgi:acyl-CoA reductase-like NAD-dependent aldehyde dehydrogenase
MVQGIEITDGHIIIDRNPATGEVIAKVPASTREDVLDAIERSVSAQASWGATPLDERIALLKEGCAVLGRRVDELANKITEEMGKPIREAREEAEGAVDKDGFLDLVEKANAEELLGGDDGEEAGGSQSLVVRDPLGVVAVISPWNFPSDEILLLALPALAAGNTVVVKPSEVTPLVGNMTVEAVASALPPNVLQIVQGDGEVGSWLVENQNVNMVAMTGSTAVGKSIMSQCSQGLKRLVLELGGKDPMVVFADADLDLAASDAVEYSLSNTGQVCCSFERVYVESSIKDEFESKVVEIAAAYTVGDGRDEENKVGPLVSQLQRDRVADQVDAALKSGAKLLFKSATPESAKEGASYYPVTVLGDVEQSYEIQNVETFGPVVSLATFDGTEEEAIRLANDTEYGLASAVYTTDCKKAIRVARRIRSGQVGINCYSINYANTAAPWVGHRNSGHGYHSGMDGWRQFSVPKSLVFTGSVSK